MQKPNAAFRPNNAKAELKQALTQGKGLFWMLALFSVFVNLLMLTVFPVLMLGMGLPMIYSAIASGVKASGLALQRLSLVVR